MKRAAWRLACKSPRFPKVIMRSAQRFASLALGAVVEMRSWRNSEVTMLRSMARRCDGVLPSLRTLTRCRIALALHRDLVLGLGHVRSDVHAEVQAHALEDLGDLAQALAAEVLVLEHLRLA